MSFVVLGVICGATLTLGVTSFWRESAQARMLLNHTDQYASYGESYSSLTEQQLQRINRTATVPLLSLVVLFLVGVGVGRALFERKMDKETGSSAH